LYRNFLKIFEPIIVPEGQVKTKPRACNYGLIRANGEYVTIYDAEDDPEPDQLKKALISFQRMGQGCVCLQSHLNFYNSEENLLTKWFSLEYLYWFDYYLEGLDGIDAPIPLGGTSNHFKTKRLRRLGSWDPYNVTEDADLGIRIYRSGLKTGMLNSYTYEEANNNVWNWIRQRSRWCKGHMQTFLVQMRHPRKMIRDMGWKKFVLFQLTFGGNILLPLINPLLWAITILTLLFSGTFSFLSFAPWIAFINTFNLIAGNLVHISLYLRTVVVEKRFSFIHIALTMPLYWILVSVGAWKGMIQLITKPHYWEKTIHGISKINNLETI
jgi:cellulose synthase/poly-beta-1,6-N-acetylglucosamine synthase-like glycosyltransferase